MTSKLLNRLRRSTADGQSRAERVPKDVNSSRLLQVGSALRFSHPVPDDGSIELLVAIPAQDSSATQLAIGLQQCSQPFGRSWRPASSCHLTFCMISFIPFEAGPALQPLLAMKSIPMA